MAEHAAPEQNGGSGQDVGPDSRPTEPGEAQDPASTGRDHAADIAPPEGAPPGRHLGTALRLLAVSLLILSVAYPAVITSVGEMLFRRGARGGIIELRGEAVGAALIGQQFSSDVFFHPRPSSKGYDGMDSGSQNLAPSNSELTERVRRRLEELERQGIAPDQVPVGWVTESGSSLDPHIGPRAAQLQVPRVSRATGLPGATVQELIEKHTEGKFLGLFGEERVNVLLLNLDIRERLGELE